MAIVAVFGMATVPVDAQENEVTAIRPGGTYHVYFTVKKPAGMSLTENWEVRVYFYNGANCYNTAPSGDDDGWWNPSGNIWLYTGFWDHRTATRNVSWISPDEKTWAQWVPIIHYPAENGNHEARYPPYVGENFENKMDEIPVGGTVNVMARLVLRNLTSVTFNNVDNIVTFKYNGETYSYKFISEDIFPIEYRIVNFEIGPNVTLRQSWDNEWMLSFDQTMTILVDNNAPATGKITIPSAIYTDDHWLEEFPWAIIVGVLIAVALVVGLALAWKRVVRR